MGLDDVDHDLLEDLLGRVALADLLDEVAGIYNAGIPDRDWEDMQAARGIAAETADTIRPIVGKARMSIAAVVRDGHGVARELGL